MVLDPDNPDPGSASRAGRHNQIVHGVAVKITKRHRDAAFETRLKHEAIEQFVDEAAFAPEDPNPRSAARHGRHGDIGNGIAVYIADGDIGTPVKSGERLKFPDQRIVPSIHDPDNGFSIQHQRGSHDLLGGNDLDQHHHAIVFMRKVMAMHHRGAKVRGELDL